jgi:undecaprenyl-diphosphatase
MDIEGSLKEADKTLFYLVNNQFSISPVDNLMLLLRQPYTWIPLYLFFLLFFYFNCRKYLLPIIALSLVTFALTDFTSASIIKPMIGRLRPCHDPELQSSIHNLAGCGGSFGMPSTHASNHFGLATFWFTVIKQTVNRKWLWLWVWAFIICYAQVYVGVHFPGDVLMGALLGVIIGLVTSSVFARRMAQIDALKADV